MPNNAYCTKLRTLMVIYVVMLHPRTMIDMYRGGGGVITLINYNKLIEITIRVIRYCLNHELLPDGKAILACALVLISTSQ